MTDRPGEDDAPGPAFSPAPPVEFSPAPPVEFSPDDPGHRLEAPPEPLAAREPEGFPGHEPRRLFDPGPAVEAGDDAGVGGPLWGSGPPPPDAFDDDRSGGNWVLVTLVLMVVFVAIAFGFTALTDWGDSDDLRSGLDDSALGRVDAEEPGATTTAPEASTTAPPTTGAPATTTAPTSAAPATWAPFAAPDGAFTAELPTPVTELPAGPSPGVREYRAEGDGVTYSIRSEPFAPTDAEAVALGLAAAADSVLPAGVTAESSGVQSFPGGVSVYDFTARVGDSSVTGRAEVASGRRFVLTASVAADRATEPAVLADLVRFRNGFTPGA